MKILHATKKYPDAIGGDARVVFYLEREQQNSGHQVFILTSDCPEVIRKENVFRFGLVDHSTNLDSITFRRLISLLMLLISGLLILHRIKPDIIHTHSPDMGFIISFQAYLFHIPVIHTCHGVTFSGKQFSPIKGLIESFLLKYGRFSRIVTVDRSSLPSFAEHNIRGVCYIANGVDIDFFKRPRGKIRDYPGIRFMFVGRLEEQKGLTYLLLAAKQFSKDFQGFEIIIIGEGSRHNELMHTIKKEELSDSVRILGKVSQEEVIQHYNSNDVFILPSIWEGLPLTLLEAWAAGLAVIVTNVGDIPYICENMKNALIVQPQDPEELSNAMLLLARDAQLRYNLAKCGEETVRHGYSWCHINDEYLELYGSFLFCQSKYSH